jgi:Mrp family chromosome partitioning ATPase
MTPIMQESASRPIQREASSYPAGQPLPFSDEVHQHYRALLRRLNWPGSETSAAPQTLGLTSSTSGEGVTTVALQLAATAATMLNRRILLVDANVRHPATSRQFGHQNKNGFAQAVLTGDCDAAAYHSTPIAGLSVLAAGAVPDENMDQVYDSPSLAGLVEELKSQFDLVVFDLPPAGASCTPLRLAELLDGVLLVVESQRACLQETRRVRDLLAHARVRLVGAVLNERH